MTLGMHCVLPSACRLGPALHHLTAPKGIISHNTARGSVAAEIHARWRRDTVSDTVSESSALLAGSCRTLRNLTPLHLLSDGGTTQFMSQVPASDSQHLQSSFHNLRPDYFDILVQQVAEESHDAACMDARCSANLVAALAWLNSYLCAHPKAAVPPGFDLLRAMASAGSVPVRQLTMGDPCFLSCSSVPWTQCCVQRSDILLFDQIGQ